MSNETKTLDMETDGRLTATQRAFDSVAETYDGPRGNNALIQRMRDEMWAEMDRRFSVRQTLLDLGCGTGIDALHFAQRGYRVLATDWSPHMVARASDRAVQHAVADNLIAKHIGLHELENLDASFSATFDGIYSNFGPLNCAPDLAQVSRQCARLLRPGGKLVFTVIGRICPLGSCALPGQAPVQTRHRALYKTNDIGEPKQAHGMDALLHAARVLCRVVSRF